MNFKKFKQFEKQAFSTVYSELEGGFHDVLIPEIVERFLPEFNLGKSAQILDIGCGPGLFMQQAKKLGYDNCTGVTLSTEDVLVCREKGFNTVEANMTDLPMLDESVDFIWCRHALEHSPYPLFTLFEFYRVLKPNGQAFIEVPSPNNERIHVHEYNPNHYSILGEAMWQGLFDKAKFKTLNFWNYDATIPFTHKTIIEKSYMFVVQKLD
jgi:ubiquinone/menaquinone biosynthesis C-methylase UbiE